MAEGSEAFEEDRPFVVEPYRFEPPARNSRCSGPREHNSSSDSSSDEDRQPIAPTPSQTAVDDWCTCGNCIDMPTRLECRCCTTFTLCEEKVMEANITCITEHEGFIVNCLNRHVLEVALYDYLDINGPVGDEEPIHQLYRHLAYRRFTRWIWHRLGRHNRKVLPSCVVKKIRGTFPSEEYTGFKYPRDF